MTGLSLSSTFGRKGTQTAAENPDFLWAQSCSCAATRSLVPEKWHFIPSAPVPEVWKGFAPTPAPLPLLSAQSLALSEGPGGFRGLNLHLHSSFLSRAGLHLSILAGGAGRALPRAEGFDWKRNLKPIQFRWAGTAPTVPGCSKPWPCRN